MLLAKSAHVVNGGRDGAVPGPVVPKRVVDTRNRPHAQTALGPCWQLRAAGRERGVMHSGLSQSEQTGRVQSRHAPPKGCRDSDPECFIIIFKVSWNLLEANLFPQGKETKKHT